MSSDSLVKARLEQIHEGIRRIQRRFAGIESAEDFLNSDEGLDRLDGIGMMLIAIGENLKKVDKATKGAFLERYPNINWRGAMGVRDILSHHYFDLDAEAIFAICQKEIPDLAITLERMRNEFD